MSKQAFPLERDQIYDRQPGMTLREWYAGLAMQSLITRGAYCKDEEIAIKAIQMADALLENLKKEG